MCIEMPFDFVPVTGRLFVLRLCSQLMYACDYAMPFDLLGDKCEVDDKIVQFDGVENLVGTEFN
jgi:hypothetical protein